MRIGTLRPTGTLGLTTLSRTAPLHNLSLRAILRQGFPRFGQPQEVFRWRLFNCRRLLWPMTQIALSNIFQIPTFVGSLYLIVHRADGTRIEYGLASLRAVTDVAVGIIAAQMAAQTGVIDDWDFHGIGTWAADPSNPADQTDTALDSELTTQYDNGGNVRATGTPSNPSANVYRTVATNEVDTGVSIKEHGIFTQAATGGGNLLDRHTFGVITLTADDSIQSTYDLTITAGG